MITTTLGILVAAALDTERGLSPWSRLIGRDWPMRTAYQMKKLTGLIRAELTAYTELHTAVVKELGTENPAGGWTVTPANWLTFQQRMTELLAEPVTLPWAPIPIADLGDVTISGADLAALDALVVGEPVAPAEQVGP